MFRVCDRCGRDYVTTRRCKCGYRTREVTAEESDDLRAWYRINPTLQLRDSLANVEVIPTRR